MNVKLSSDGNKKLPLTAHRKILNVFIFILTIFVLLTISNELLDLPRYLFGDQPTSFSQRKGEVIFEILIYFIVLSIAFYIFEKKIKAEIKILEGFIPICASCKKIRQDIDWKVLEEYISENSLAKFTHSICPECASKLYLGIKDKTPSYNQDKNQGDRH
jgi:hypothetical protein